MVLHVFFGLSCPWIAFFSVSGETSLSCRNSVLAGLSKATRRVDTPDTLYIITWCGFGNALYQLAQAINYASYLSVSGRFY
jgi:hypothetical protein